MRKDT